MVEKKSSGGSGFFIDDVPQEPEPEPEPVVIPTEKEEPIIIDIYTEENETAMTEVHNEGLHTAIMLFISFLVVTILCWGDIKNENPFRRNR